MYVELFKANRLLLTTVIDAAPVAGRQEHLLLDNLDYHSFCDDIFETSSRPGVSVILIIIHILTSLVFFRPLASHALAVILIVIGCLMLFVGIRHHMVRRGVYLASAPGSIASGTSLTSHSGFGMLLNPYDTDAEIAAKMGQLLFSLDRRTGAITAIDNPGGTYLRRNVGKKYLDDSLEKDGNMSSPVSLSRVQSRERPNEEGGYIIEQDVPGTPPPHGHI